MVKVILLLTSLLAAAGSVAANSAVDEDVSNIHFRPIRAQFIAALGDGSAQSGVIDNDWAIWEVDPGPRGVWLRNYDKLSQANNKAPAGWEFDPSSFWIDENGLLMEKPKFSLRAGHYLVTGEREVITVLSVSEKDADGKQTWKLAHEASLEDVTHMPCRSARYTPLDDNTGSGDAVAACSPANAPRSAFKVPPGSEMPMIEGCAKQDFRVLIVIGLPANLMQ